MWWTSHFLQSSSLTTLVPAPEILQICSCPICHMVVSCVGWFQTPTLEKGRCFFQHFRDDLPFFRGSITGFVGDVINFGGDSWRKPNPNMIDMIDLVNLHLKELNERNNPQFSYNISLPTNVLGLAWLEIGVVLSKKKGSTFPRFKINFTEVW